MIRGLCLLLLCAGLVHAQEKDDEGMTIDEPPPPEEPGGAPERTTAYPAREPGKKPATVVIKKKVYSIALPADWVLHAVDEPNTELAWDVLLPGSTTRAALYLSRKDDNIPDPRSAPYYHVLWLKKDKPDETAEVRTKPCPRIVTHRKLNAIDWIDAFFYLSVLNNRYAFQLSCSAVDFPQAEADVLAAVASFSAKVEIWPPIPKGYEVSDEGTWLVARAPAVTASLAPLVKGLKDQEKRFRRDHGPLPKSDAPIVVLVHASAGDAAQVDPDAAKGNDGFWADERHRRLFAAPLDKDNLDQQGWLAAGAQALLFLARYGDISPSWVCSGERTVARAEAMTRKPLPSLDEGFVGWIPKLRLHRLDELDAMRSSEKPDWDTLSIEGFFYVAMLHEGKYRKEYREFLEDYAETGDGEGAFRRRLGQIDQDAFRAAANEFTTRIKEVKREKK